MNSDDCVLINPKKIKQEPMETVILLDDECDPMDQNNMQKAPTEPNIQIKIEDLKQERKDQYDPKLDHINEDMLQYESREGLMAKIKVEPGPQRDCTLNDIAEQPSFNKIKFEPVNNSEINVKTEKVLHNGPGKALATKIKEELTPDNDRMLIDSEQPPAFSDEMAASTCTAKNDRSGNETSVLTANNPAESGKETWEPIPVRKVDHYFGENDEEKGSDTHKTTTRQVQVTNKVNEPVNEHSHNKKDRDQLVKHSKESSSSNHSWGAPAPFKDPNKVLDKASYVYRKKETIQKRNHNSIENCSSVFYSNDLTDTNTLTEKLKLNMEKKHIAFVNKRTNQRRETFLTYFDNAGIEVILVSDRHSDKFELYSKSEHPNTFYRLFYNFNKATEIGPVVSDMEAEFLEAYIKECKLNKGDAETATKRPRLSPTLQHAQSSEGDIIRSARKLNRTEKDHTLPSYQSRSDSRENFERSWRNVRKIGNGYATESYTNRQIDNRRSNRDSPSHYWDFRGRRNYICKN